MADPYIDDVVLLLHCDGTAGSHTFVDNSPLAKTYTATGGCVVDTTVKKFGTGSMVYTTPDAAYVGFTSSSKFDFGTGDFTIECWAHCLDASVYQPIMSNDSDAGNIYIYADEGGVTAGVYDGSSSFDTGPISISDNAWHHIAFVRASGDLQLYLDGTAAGVAVECTTDLSDDACAYWLGSYAGGDTFNGYIDDFRITKGVARYTTTFTPPTAQFPDDVGGDANFADVSLLLHFNGTNGSTTFTDSSGSPTTVAKTGIDWQVLDTSTKKFGTASLYSPGQNVSQTVLPWDAAFSITGDFTLELWLYYNQASADSTSILLNSDGAISGGGNGLRLSLYDGEVEAWLYSAGFGARVGYGSFPALTVGNWVHIALVRASGVADLYLDGVGSGSPYASEEDLSANNGGYIIGPAYAATPTVYIDDLRLTVGTARYTDDFTPPTAAFENAPVEGGYTQTGDLTLPLVLASGQNKRTPHLFQTGDLTLALVLASGQGILTPHLTCLLQANGTASYRSEDGLSWDAAGTMPMSGWTACAYGNGMFCAIGPNGAATSTDGRTWTAVNTQSNIYCYNLTYGGGVFLGLQSGTKALTSTDGVTWTSTTLPNTGNGWQAVAWNGTLFCAVALYNWTVITSPDGVTWTEHTVPQYGGYYNIAWNGSIFCVIDHGMGRGMTSPDGITWSIYTDADATGDTGGLVWNGTVFCAIYGGWNDKVITSPNGTTWSSHTLPTGKNWWDLIWNGETYLAVSGTSTAAATSPDGITWTGATLPVAGYGGRTCVVTSALDPAFAVNHFIFIGAITLPLSLNSAQHTAIKHQTSDLTLGLTLASEQHTLNKRQLGNVPLTLTPGARMYTQDTFMLGFSYNTAYSATSVDGYTWVKQEFSGLPYAACYSVVWNGELFCGLVSSSKAATSTDGVNWTQRDIPGYVEHGFTSMAWDGNQFLAIGYVGYSASSPDGITWTELFNLSQIALWRDLVWDKTTLKFVMHGGDQGIASKAIAYSPDGLDWVFKSSALPITAKWRGLARGVYFCTVAYGTDTSAVSLDGITWSAGSLPVIANWIDVAWSGKVFCAIAAPDNLSTPNNIAAISTDGVNWTQVWLPVDSVWDSITWNGNVFVVASTYGNKDTALSSDGVTWELGELPADAANWDRLYTKFVTDNTPAAATGEVAFNFTMPTLTATGHSNLPNSVTAGFITSTMEALGGWNGAGGFLTSSLSATGTLTEAGTATLPFITTTLTATMNVDERAAGVLGFISSTLTALGGGNAAFDAPVFTFSGAGTDTYGVRGNLSADFLSVALAATGTVDARGAMACGFIDTYLSYNNFAFAGPVLGLSASGGAVVANSVAYVMNVVTTESWQYSNYPFMHIVTIGGKPYGVTSTGLYLLEGATDAGTAINGTVTTKSTDFGSFHSKRLQYAYIGSDSSTTLTPIVDGVTKQSHASAFGGRKTLMSKGNVGRYWQVRISNIQELTGLELLPQELQRRVK